MLVHLRGRAVDEAPQPRLEWLAMRLLAWVFGSERRFALAQRLGRVAARPFVRAGRITSLPGLGAWTNSRDLPPVAARTFREWWDSR